MKNEKPLILISNDDGYFSKGLRVLVETLSGLGEIVVMAPDGPRSGASGAITSELPVRYNKKKTSLSINVPVRRWIASSLPCSSCFPVVRTW